MGLINWTNYDSVDSIINLCWMTAGLKVTDKDLQRAWSCILSDARNTLC